MTCANEKRTADFYRFHPELESLRTAIATAKDLLLETYSKGGKLLICGNGGSCADADHIVGELMKGFLLPRPLSKTEREQFRAMAGTEGIEIAEKLQGSLPAISLGAHAALMSAFENDVDPALVYAQQAYGYAHPEDLILGISTSGNAKNVCAAMIAAGVRGAKRIALTGRDGGKLAALSDCAIIVPEMDTYLIQEYHLMIYHYLCATIESEIFTGAEDGQ